MSGLKDNLKNLSTDVTNLYLYNQETPPDISEASALPGPSVERTAKQVEVSDFMSGAGKYAVGAQFEVVQRFFDDVGYTIPDGTYSKTAIL